MKPVLEVKRLTMDFGGLRAIDALDLSVMEEEIVALIGPNGAGKTTFFNCITGIYPPNSGEIALTVNGKKERLNGLKPNQATAKGVARTFQNIRLFPTMSVLENVMIGRHVRSASGILGALFRDRKTVKEEQEIVEKSYGFLEKVGLHPHVNDLAMNLPYGAQRKLEIARALATEPALLLLDEPAAGLNQKETRDLNELILTVRNTEKISILLIEHDMRLVMRVSDRIYVMEYGRQIACGTPVEIQKNPSVIRAYLGEESDA